SVLGARITVLGAAFKPESDDVRDSPALNVAGQLQLGGAEVTVFDPQAMDNARKIFPTLRYATNAIEACSGADAVLVLTEWQEFRRLDQPEVALVVRSRVILDGRNCLDARQRTSQGWNYWKLGAVPPSSHLTERRPPLAPR